VVFRDGGGRVRLVRPTYKPGWEVPGGAIEAGESPLDGARREVREELGRDFPVGRLLVVDWVAPAPPWDAGLMFLFDGGTLDAADAARITLPPDELAEFAFVTPGELPARLVPRLARRVAAALDAGGAVYLENGWRPPDQSPSPSGSSGKRRATGPLPRSAPPGVG
jgi:8-oxo-dGTP diphosphatase